MASSFFVGGAGLGVWAANIPLIKASLALDEAGLGVVLMGVAVGCIAGMPLAGLLIPRLGPTRALTTASVMFAIALCGPPLAPSFVSLTGAAILLGAAFGVLDVSMNSHAAMVEKALARPIMSSIHAFFSIGALAGSALGAALISVGLGPLTGLSLSSGALLALTAAAAPHMALPGAAGHKPGDTQIFRLPTLAVLGVGALTIAAFVIELGVIDWGAVLMIQATGASPAFAAFGLAAFSAAMAAGRLSGDWMVARVGPLGAVRLSGFGGALGLMIVAASSASWITLTGFAIAGFTMANVVPVLFSSSARLPGVAPAAGVAMAVTMAYGGGLFGPPLIGFAANAFGIQSAFTVLAVCALGIAVAVRRFIPPAAFLR
ncbi:MAG TPA: MFS transporter [Hansschlegelia sp.]